MRFRLACLAILSLFACDLGKITVGTTAKVLQRAQPSLQQESDYEMAARALPGALKTIEGFWIVDPDNEILIGILTEGYCQYGTAFVEDEWEVAKDEFDAVKTAKAREAVEYHNVRATKMFTRCLNFALKELGTEFQQDIFAEQDKAVARIKQTTKRTPLMWAGLALGSIINHNLTRVEMIAYLPTVRAMMDRVIELDAKDPPKDPQLAALPHIALGMIDSATGKELGGDAQRASAEFQTALKITNDKMLLARALWAYRVGLMTRNRKLFHDQLKLVLETPPSVWPEQRLANEVAHRRARRYLSHEKELFQ
jgi:hypothetical protein